MTAGDWADRIQKAPSVSEKVTLHDERFQIWNTFINAFATKYNCIIQEEARPKEKASAFEQMVVNVGNTFAKKTLIRNNIPVVVFDAAFGSMDATSDLDIGVIGTSIEVLENWIPFVKTQQKVIPSKSLTFTQYWDSNFYFEPGVVQNGRLISKIQANLEQALPTRESMVHDMELIEKYAKAYEEKNCMKLDKFYLYPNPEAPGFTQETEIQQYQAMAEYGKKCYENFTPNSVSKLACCKTEGLICAGSLAICGVFGKDIQHQFIYDKVGQPWRLIAAFEMLLNLKIHMHAGMVKTKYLERLDNVLRNGQNACKEMSRVSVTKDIHETKSEGKLAKLQGKVLVLINMIVEDEQDGAQCPTYTKSKRTFDQDIHLMKELIKRHAAMVKVSNPNNPKFVTYCEKKYTF